MDIYILIMSLCLGLAIVELAMAGKRRYRYLHFYLFGIVFAALFLIAGFRACGFDYESYYELYVKIKDLDWSGIEPAYVLLNRIAPDYHAVIIMMSLAILWVQFKFIWRYTMLPILAVVFYLGLYMYPSAMGQFRQFLAVGIVLWAYANKESKIKFFSLIGLAMTFHYSAIIGALVFFIPADLKGLKFYILVFIASLVCSNTMYGIYINFINYLPGYMAMKLNYYAAVQPTALGLNTAVLIRAFLFFSCYYFRKELVRLPKMSLYINIYFLSMVIYTAFGFAQEIAVRGSIYFSFFEIILSANLIFALKGWKKVMYFCIFVGFSIYRQINFFNEWPGSYIPYKNWLIDYLT